MMGAAFPPILSPTHTLQGHAEPTKLCAIAPDGSTDLSSSAGSTASARDLPEGGSARAALLGHSDVPAQCGLPEGGAIAATASWGGSARAWGAKAGSEVLMPRRDGDWAVRTGCALLADGGLLFATLFNAHGRQGQATLHDWRRGRAIAATQRPRKMRKCAASRDAGAIAFAWERLHGGEVGVEIVDRDGVSLRSISCSGGLGAAMSCTGPHAAAADKSHLGAHEARGSEGPAAMQGHRHGASACCAVAPSGAHAAAAARGCSHCCGARASGALPQPLAGILTARAAQLALMDRASPCALMESPLECGARPSQKRPASPPAGRRH